MAMATNLGAYLTAGRLVVVVAGVVVTVKCLNNKDPIFVLLEQKAYAFRQKAYLGKKHMLLGKKQQILGLNL